jgi:SAM-dependent methyltransferase
VELGRQFDGVILLYDVIGSYADDESNEAILENAARHLRTGGVLVFSVMSWSYTWKRAKHTASMTSNPGALMKVKPSAIMETSGDVFDPDHYLCDDETHLVYRREQFGPGNGLPSELVVRDRRYTDDEVRRMVAKAGLRLVELSPVRAGKWQMPCEAGEGKELLAVARKL